VRGPHPSTSALGPEVGSSNARSPLVLVLLGLSVPLFGLAALPQAALPDPRLTASLANHCAELARNSSRHALAERFADADQDGPSAHALFLTDPDDEKERARLGQEAVATVREFLAGFRGA
jgi:hypothetical protein